MKSVPKSELPPYWIPLEYYILSVVSFCLAMAGMARYSHDLTGFYYHPRILALTHLITLGWITANILGSLYIVGPMSLGIKIRSRVLDQVIFAFFAIGLSGMASHFWIDQPSGMAWSAVCADAAVTFFAIRTILQVRKARAQGFVKFHLICGSANLLIAAGWGVLIAFNKSHGFLATTPMGNVLAHLHLAAIGWGILMVFGMAYRLLPMFVPGEPVKGRWPWMSGILLQSGTLGLFFSLVFESRATIWFSLLILLGIVIFLGLAMRTIRRRKPEPPPERPRPDFSLGNALLGFASLAAAAVAGLFLTRMAPTERSLQISLAYGFLGIVGFLSQMIFALRPRILSIFTWYYAFDEAGDSNSIKRPIDMPLRSIQAMVFFLWFFALPAAVSGIVLQRNAPILCAGVLLVSAGIVQTVHEIYILKSPQIVSHRS